MENCWIIGCEWKGKGASRTEHKSTDGSTVMSVSPEQMAQVHADIFSNSLQTVTAESLSIVLRSDISEVGNTEITAYIPREGER